MAIQRNKKGRALAVLAISGLFVAGTMVTNAFSSKKNAVTEHEIDLNQYLGTWHEVARKPMYFQKKCDFNVSATYSLNENGSIKVDNRCYSKNGKLRQSIGQATVKNAPLNSKLKVSFLPKIIRWLPVGRGDYWILKIDEAYQTVLVGSPSKKYLWVLSRTPQAKPDTLKEYLDYAAAIGYDTKDVIFTQQKAQ